MTVYIIPYRGYKYSWFSRIKHVPRTFITLNLISHACMLQKGCYSTKMNAKIYTLEIYPLYGTVYTYHNVVPQCFTVHSGKIMVKQLTLGLDL